TSSRTRARRTRTSPSETSARGTTGSRTFWRTARPPGARDNDESRERRRPMALPVNEFAAALLAEARETHPWLHHPLFRMIEDGRASREQVRNVIRQQGGFFLDTLRHAAWKIVSVGGFTPTWEDLERQRALIP